MNRPMLGCNFTIYLAIWAFLGCFAGSSHAQWAITGTTPGGGNVVSGTGCAGPLPSGLLAPGGSNQVTLQAGGVASSTCIPVTFGASNETFTNFGRVCTSGIDVAVAFLGTATLSHETVNNFGAITGFPGSGIGVAFQSLCGGLIDTRIVNSGSIAGGDANAAGNGIFLCAQTSGINGVAILNSGSIAGGNGTVGAGNGIFAFTIGTLENAQVTNSGLIVGGTGSEGGRAINFAGGAVDAVQIENTGWIRGGASMAIIVAARCTDLTHFQLNNSGSISGGNNGDAVRLRANQSICTAFVNNSGAMLGRSQGGCGFSLNAESGVASKISLTNSGTISGGNCCGQGIAVRGGCAIQTAALVNSGTITGGAINGNAVFFDSPNLINGVNVVNSGLLAGGFCGGNGILITAGVQVQAANIVNHGTIGGGSGGFCCCSIGPSATGAGDGIQIKASSGLALAITNFGTISGGAAGSCPTGGAGVNSTAGSLTVNNWGIIAGGAGMNPIAVQLNISSNNAVNLNGHSSTHGMVTADGSNNYLNLNFTGLSPAEIARIRADLNAHEILNGIASSGSVTVRGELVQWDPLIVTFNPQSYQLQGLSPNQQALGASLDSLTSNPPPGSCTADLLNAIDLSGDVPQALNALSPQRYQIYGDIAKASANLRVTEVNRRLNDLRTGSAGVSPTTTETVVRRTDAKDGFFTSGYGTFANLDGNRDLDGARFTSFGVIAGVDHRYSDKLVAGALFNYTSTQASLDGLGSGADVQGFGTGLYAGYTSGAWFANGLLTYDRTRYSSNRRILFPGFDQMAVARTDGDLLIGDLNIGRDSRVSDRWTVGPELGLQYVHLGVDGFTEMGGAGAALAIGDSTVNAFRSRLGGRADYVAPALGDRVFALELRAAWQHDFDDDNRLLATFVTGGFTPFGVETRNLARDSVLAGVGANWTGGDVTSYIRYDIQANDDSSLQYASAGLRMRF